MLKKIMPVFLLILLSACVTPPPPYFGLDKNSYGALSTQKLQYCDPYANTNITSDIKANDISRKLVGGILSPILKNSTTIDKTILETDLLDKFKIPGDIGVANVSILSRSPEEVVFWYVYDVVSFEEVSAAAMEFCGREKQSAIYQGSAKRCSEPMKAPFTIRGQPVTVRLTYVISDFICKDNSSTHKGNLSTGKNNSSTRMKKT